jgi:hypothetical protein
MFSEFLSQFQETVSMPSAQVYPEKLWICELKNEHLPHMMQCVQWKYEDKEHTTKLISI